MTPNDGAAREFPFTVTEGRPNEIADFGESGAHTV
jgi:hypothetical protein